MTHFIVCNTPKKFEDFFGYYPNFQITHLRQKEFIPSNNLEDCLEFSIYVQSEADTSQYSFGQGMRFNYIESKNPSESLSDIFSTIEHEAALLDEGEQTSVVIAIANREAGRGLRNSLAFSKRFEELEYNGIAIMDIYEYFGISNNDELADKLKLLLNTPFIYPDDSVNFSYALYSAMIDRW